MSELDLMIIGGIMAISEYIKVEYLPLTIGKFTITKKMIPIIDLMMSLFAVILFFPGLTIREYIIKTIIIAASAIGVYSGYKNTMQNKSNAKV